MTNNLSNSQFSQTKTKLNSFLKLVLFEVGKLTLALPVRDVEKVIKLTPIYSSGLNHMGITHFGEKEITVIDLHKKLFQISQINELASKGYLIITKNNSTEEQLGLVVAETPTLIDVPLSKIRTLPDSYRRADTLEIASHVALIPQNDLSLTVFLLDLERLLSSAYSNGVRSSFQI